MDYVRFGRTGLNVSVMGLGCGGPSRIGIKKNKSENESVEIVRRALDSGVNFIDTAEVYGTEEVVGKALQEFKRDSIVISTKKNYRSEISPGLLRKGLEASLNRLRTDYIDIYNLHGVSLADYAMLRDEILPTFTRLKDEGKIRFIGVSETFNDDRTHQMLLQSLPDDVWDVVMVGFNMLNQSARSVFKQTCVKDVAVQVMYAVRRALSQPDKLLTAVNSLVEQGQLNPDEVDINDPFGFVLKESDAITLVEAAYRFCRYEPGVHVVLSGTGNPDHLQSNIDSLNRPPLPENVVQKLRFIFRHANAVTGQ